MSWEKTVEQVAAAICKAHKGKPHDPNSSGMDQVWQGWDTEARAAITALRTPTEEQLAALGKLINERPNATPKEMHEAMFPFTSGGLDITQFGRS